MPDDAAPDLLMTPEELAEYLQLSVKTIYKLLRSGQIPFLYVGGCFRFDSDEIKRWMANRQVNV
jgi:excisionase family DNA binding protein